jgi:hypothetical protein
MAVPRRPVVRPPESLPGELAVLEFERISQIYRLYVDDDDKSNYLLGSSAELIARLFDGWGYTREGAELVDRAREFGKAMLRFHERTVIALHPPSPKIPDLFEEKNHGFAQL